MLRFVAGIFVTAALSSSAFSQEDVTFPTAPSKRFPDAVQVEAILTLPPKSAGKVPAVVLIHTGGGYDSSHYEYYGVPLRDAGIATFGVILFRAGFHLPSVFLPHAFGALKYLASHPRIDPDRIGIMGFSLGGHLSLFTASASLASEHLGGGGPRFAAHMPFYPTCWIQNRVLASPSPTLKLGPDTYASLTGAPIHMLVGGIDQLEDPDGCQKFVEAFSPDARKAIALTVLPNGTHNWDAGRSYTYFDRIGCKGKGCNRNVVFDRDTAQKGRQIAVEFFTSHLLRPDKR